MTRHRHIQRYLYDDIIGDITPELHTEIGLHLQSCEKCRRAYDGIVRTLSLVRPPEVLPSEERSSEFWETFAARVDRSLDTPAGHPIPSPAGLKQDIHGLLSLRWQTAAAIASACALVAGAFLLFRTVPPGPATVPPPAGPVAAVPGTPVNEDVSRYFRKSQTLLVGLENKKPVPGNRLDIDAEREASRSLALEARLLKHQDLDPKSAQLVGDLERIFIELANTDSHSDPRDMELIRGGIRQENLLFKVRMAQARFDPDGNH